MNLFREIRSLVVAELEKMSDAGELPEAIDCARVNAEPPRDASHGDVATNAAMVLAKAAGKKPRDLADRLVSRLVSHPKIASATVAGPGFINLTLDPSLWHDQLRAILQRGADYGQSDMGGREKVNVEYVSANPTGPLTVGHARGAVVGDALASLLDKAGYAVTREYYINDAGTQVDVLARSAHLRYREALGEEIGEIPVGHYPGEYLKAVGQALAARDGDHWRDLPESEWLQPVRSFAIDFLMNVIRDDLAVLGIHQEVFTSERAVVQAGGVDRVLETLEAKGLIYVGVLEPPKGKKPDDWEPRPQTLFRATDFGDDVDRALKKSDGTWTYFANDMANHLDKAERGFLRMIDVWGADHSGYIKRMQSAVKALTDGEGDLNVRICQLVTLLRDGEPVRMSKRAGAFVTLREVIDEVGKDVVRFIMLTRKNDATLEFDLAKVMEQSRDNPVFYVQYAHARCRSVLRGAAEAVPDLDCSATGLAGADLSLLKDEEEMALIKRLASWPRLVEAAAEAFEPHRVAFYLQELAAQFHGLWNKGKEDASLRFIREDDLGITLARMALLQSVAHVIASGLGVFGVEPVEELR